MCSSVDRHIAWLHNVAILSSVTLNIDVQVSLERVAWSLLGKFSGAYLIHNGGRFSCVVPPFPGAWTVVDQWLLLGVWVELEHRGWFDLCVVRGSWKFGFSWLCSLFRPGPGCWHSSLSATFGGVI